MLRQRQRPATATGSEASSADRIPWLVGSLHGTTDMLAFCRVAASPDSSCQMLRLCAAVMSDKGCLQQQRHCVTCACVHACLHSRCARRQHNGWRPAAQAHARSCVLLYMLWVSLAKQSAGCGSSCCWPQLVMVWFAVLPVGWPARLLSLRRSTCGDQLRVSLSTGLCKQGVERQVLSGPCLCCAPSLLVCAWQQSSRLVVDFVFMPC